MRNATCARTETSKLPTEVALLYGSLFYGRVFHMTRILIVEDVGLQYFDNCMAIKYEKINI